MVRKILMWTVMVFVLCSTASALMTDSLTAYWSFDNDTFSGNDIADETGNGYTALNVGTTYDPGVVGDGRSFDGVNDWINLEYINGTGNPGIFGSQPAVSINYWVKAGAAEGPGFLQDYCNGDVGWCTSGTFLWSSRFHSTNEHQVLFGTAGFGDWWDPNFASNAVAAWEMVTWTYDGSTMKIYVNGTYRSNSTSFSGNTRAGDETNFSAGRVHQNDDSYNYWAGQLDEIGVWRRALTASEVSTLWNGGAGMSYDDMSTNFTITATNIYGDVILNFTANISGTEYQSNASGSIVTNYTKAPSSTINITVSGADATLVDATYNSRSTSTDLAAVLNTTYYRLQVNATTIGGAAINNFTINITSLTDTSDNQSLNTTSGSITFNVTQNFNYSVWIDAPGYEIKTENVTVNTWTVNQTFTLYTTNSLSITFKDEETGAVVNNVTAELISDVFSANYTTTNGTLYLDLLSPVLYAIRYVSTSYTERFYYFNLQNRTHTNLTLYLVANSSATDVTATVYDEGNHVVEDAYIKVLRYDIVTNSYIVQEIRKTNFEGEAVLHLILSDEFYKFIIEYPQGTVKKETSPTYIFATTLTLQILLGEDVAEDFYNSEDVSYTLAFNDATNNFRYTYSDANNIVSQGCLEVFIINASTGTTAYNSSCTSSSSATILVGVANTTGTTYEAKAYVTLDGTKYYLTSLTYSFDEASVFGTYGIFLCIIITIVFLFVGIWSKAVALVLLPLPTLLFSVANIIDVSTGIMIAVEIVCVIVAIWLGRRD